ncbi:MAG: CvpA family protein [Planctomycetota bacterium]|nr:CvpA family protein [Planctomycetota bacterium]
MNIIALVALGIVAYMGLVQGLYRSAQSLAVCVLSGIIAFGLLGPVSGLLANDSPRSTWYYAADAFCLWAVFCFSFLVLRTLAAKLLPNEPGFPSLLDQLGGAFFGIATGYLVVGVCLLVVQMLPTSPELLGYEAFEFNRGKEGLPDSLIPGQPLWLQWDRGTLAFFGRLSSHPMGSDETSFYRRYGDVYPPADRRGEGYEAALDVDDVLFFYWHRRWEFFGPSPEGPIKEPPRPAPVSRDGTGLKLIKGQSDTLSGVSLRLSLVEDRVATLSAFPQEKPPAGHEFLLVTISFQPVGRLPHTIESSQFYLLDTLGPRIENPMVMGRAKANQPQNLIVAESAKPAAMTAHGAHFNILDGEPNGFYLASGASFAFTEAGQQEQRTFVFIVPKQRTNDKYRMNVHSVLPAAPAPAGAKTQEAKPPAPKAAAPAPARTPGT